MMLLLAFLSLSGWIAAFLMCVAVLREIRKHSVSLHEWSAELKNWGNLLDNWQDQVAEWSAVNEQSMQLLEEYHKWFGRTLP